MNLILKSHFSSAHLYFQPQWSEQKNKTTFGRCFTPHGHGHNYRLEVGFKINPLDINRQRDRLQEVLDSLTAVLDHEHLNFVVPEFKDTIPTTENIAHYFYVRLKASLGEQSLIFVRLYEMDNLWTEIRI